MAVQRARTDAWGMNRPNLRAFTLVEILIVVVILGILAAIVVPMFTNASEEARRAAFVSDVKVFSNAAEYYAVREGEWVPDGGSGSAPLAFRPYINVSDFESGTSLNGVWDTERFDSGVTSAVGVHFNGPDPRDDAYMTLVDAMFDDGNLATGLFRRIAADRYYAVIAE